MFGYQNQIILVLRWFQEHNDEGINDWLCIDCFISNSSAFFRRLSVGDQDKGPTAPTLFKYCLNLNLSVH